MVDEEVFKPLYREGIGAPNAPIRQMVGMICLKEGKGVSDSELYEQLRFNVLWRAAIGIEDMEEEPPVESTYYLFKQKIVEYERETGKNLMDRAFKQVTKEQCKMYNVRGEMVRMDSKLIGSNSRNNAGIFHDI
jgi:hypothetical protein